MSNYYTVHLTDTEAERIINTLNSVPETSVDFVSTELAAIRELFDKPSKKELLTQIHKLKAQEKHAKNPMQIKNIREEIAALSYDLGQLKRNR